MPTLEEMLVWRSGPVATASSALRHVAKTYAESAEGLDAFVNGEDFNGYAAQAEECSRRALADDLMDMSRALDNAGWDLHAIAEAIEALRPAVAETIAFVEKVKEQGLLNESEFEAAVGPRLKV
ncbi:MULTISPECIES: hypothetical protein [unclassified Actinobaculum]|uniref:hypothetical protein n=1 Tax=unclassified Actinobaculum TaxID=2609299 RepID=UPI000D529076|nr:MULTISPECIES: hypothetical protein [unclassified Actinobaculum]AWE42373.1 hypothetical protein DDD63_05995 [Actinobaculum sp. 313]RTE50953.1 hypothetical protein EKN07_02150 [Actinobaculum sp. 352]